MEAMVYLLHDDDNIIQLHINNWASKQLVTGFVVGKLPTGAEKSSSHNIINQWKEN